jgi:hypothetical protein
MRQGESVPSLVHPAAPHRGAFAMEDTAAPPKIAVSADGWDSNAGIA